jgi:hypothetical protein
MQNFSSESGDNITAVEAQEVLKAWTNRQQAQGVDSSVNSVTALAAGLGVSEDDVRKMLEDIRVQQRSQQIATGYLAQEQKHRKRLDVTAAVGAAIALIVLGLFVAIFLTIARRSVRQIDLNNAPPPIPSPASQPLTVRDPDGTTTTIDDNGIHITRPDGQEVQLNDPQARGRIARQLGEIKGREAAELIKKQQGPLTKQQEKEFTDPTKQGPDLRQAIKEVTDSLKETPQAPQPPPATGR